MDAQLLRGAESADAQHLAAMQRYLVVDNRMRAGIGWFYWIAGLSLVNTVAYFFGITWTFIAGLGITQLIDVIMSLVAKELGEGWGALRAAGVVVDLLIAGAFIMIGYAGRKGIQWPVIAGMVLYALDAVLLLVFRDFLAAAFHSWALFGIWTGLKAMRELRELTKRGQPGFLGSIAQQPPVHDSLP